MFIIDDVTITSLETIDAFGLNDDKYLFTLDELQDATIAQTEEKTDITGKGGRKISSVKRNKAVTINGTNGMVSNGLLEIQTGSSFENKTVKVRWTEYTTTTADSEAVTAYEARGTAGSEIISLYTRDDKTGARIKEFTQVGKEADLAEGKFMYNPTNKKITFYTDNTDTNNPVSEVEKGSDIVVIYDREITSDQLTNESDKYSGKTKLYVNALGEDKCGNVYRVQFYIPKADFSGEFSFEMGENQTVHAFEAEALAGGCGVTKGDFYTYTVFKNDAADAPATTT